MPDRGCFIYTDDTNKLMVTFEKGHPGVPVETLIPDSAKGKAFAEFELSKYFALADMILVAPPEWASFCQTLDWTGVSETQSKTVNCPSPNLDFLHLRDGKGIHQAKAEELFTIVAAYWKAAPKTMALEPGLVAGLWHGGMDAKAILAHIRQFTSPDGKLSTPTGRGVDVINAVHVAYQREKGFEPNKVMRQADTDQMLDIWIKATRSAVVGTADAENAALHWADYRRLGLVDQAGHANLKQLDRLAGKVFDKDANWAFADSVAWADRQTLSRHAATNQAANVVRSQLKRKRKQGKLNRKRGRR